MINKVILVGRLGKDPEIRTFEGGNMRASFTLASWETYKDKDGNRKEQTDWHNIVIWGKLAEIAQKYLQKGKLIYCEGKLTNRSYEETPGVKKYITEVRLDNFKMLDSLPASNTPTVSPAPPQPGDTPTDHSPQSGDGTPF